MEAVDIRAPLDAIELAARIHAARLPEVALLSSGGVSYVTAAPDEQSHAIDPHLAHRVEHAELPEWIGVIPYEARRGLERPTWSEADRRPEPAFTVPVWRRYPAIARIDAERVTVIGESRAVRRIAAALDKPAPAAPQLRLVLGASESGREHITRIARARELILDGDLYQVNLARRLELRLAEGDPLVLFRHAAQGCRFGAVLMGDRTVVSMSPELLLHAEAEDGRFTRVATEPIKGTRPRGASPEADAALAAELDADPKERAELAMIIDVERHDLGSVCDVGSVRIERAPAVHTHATVHHREARVVGTVRRDASRSEVMEAIVPSGSVTGAPKIRAMEVIAELEADRRGLYTGGIGHVTRGGSVTLAMAIRTVELEGDRATYWTGGGIVADSDPERELLETEWKARRLLDIATR